MLKYTGGYRYLVQVPHDFLTLGNNTFKTIIIHNVIVRRAIPKRQKIVTNFSEHCTVISSSNENHSILACY